MCDFVEIHALNYTQGISRSQNEDEFRTTPTQQHAHIRSIILLAPLPSVKQKRSDLTSLGLLT